MSRILRQRSVTSPLVAARAVSPRQALLPGLQELLRPAVLQAPGNELSPAQRGDAVLATEPLQNDPGVLLGRIVLPGGPTDVLNDLIGRRPPLGILSCLMT